MTFPPFVLSSSLAFATRIPLHFLDFTNLLRELIIKCKKKYQGTLLVGSLDLFRGGRVLHLKDRIEAVLLLQNRCCTHSWAEEKGMKTISKRKCEAGSKEG